MPEKKFLGDVETSGCQTSSLWGREGSRPDNKQNEIKERKQNENDTTTNEKPSDADS
jgi:hypothetical protein